MLSRVRISLILFTIVSLLVVYFTPQLFGQDSYYLHTSEPFFESPPLLLHMLIAFFLLLFTSALLYIGVSKIQTLPRAFLAYSLAYNAIIIVIKFFFSPYGLYSGGSWSSGIVEINSFFGVFAISVSVFIIYYLVYSILYSSEKKRLNKVLFGEKDDNNKKIKTRDTVLLTIGLLVALCVTGIGMFFLLFVLNIPFQYFTFVFGGGMGLVIATLLVMATYFAKKSFQSASEGAIVIRDATLLTTAFTLGSSLILIYHLLWVVYMFVLTSLWPINSYTPK